MQVCPSTSPMNLMRLSQPSISFDYWLQLICLMMLFMLIVVGLRYNKVLVILLAEGMGDEEMNELYRENLALGHRINSLTDENNFYRIQINNFNKLTNSINKDLYKLGLNFQNKEKPEDSAKIGPLFVISNKIKLKNLQMSIGNSIRKSEKFKQNLQGSPSLIAKEISELEEEISILLAKTQQMAQENTLIKNISHAQTIKIKHEQFLQQIQQSRTNHSLHLNSKMQMTKKETVKILDSWQKQIKEKSKTLNELLMANELLMQESRKYQKMCPKSEKQNQLRSREAKQLQDLQNEERRLVVEIEKYEKVLNEQYRINKDYKQRIVEKKYQENKDIKLLEEEISKCKEQVKEYKQKYKDIISSSEHKKVQRNVKTEHIHNK